jgi:hypothetical protein
MICNMQQYLLTSDKRDMKNQPWFSMRNCGRYLNTTNMALTNPQ